MRASSEPPARAGWYFCASVVFILFGGVYLCALTSDYAEGDDAYAIVHHAMGSNPGFQPPYSLWQRMIDRLLELLPHDEAVLRVVSGSVNAIAAPVLVLLLLGLATQWLRPIFRIDRQLLIVLGAVTVLASPEFIFFGLVYNPSVFGMTFVLSAHLIVRCWGNPQTRSGRWAWLAACVLFGFGTACRWDLVLYGPVIVLDLCLLPSNANRPWTPADGRVGSLRDWGGVLIGRALIFGSFGAVALSSFFLFVFLAGTSPAEVLVSAGTSINKFTRKMALTTLAVQAQPLYTPFFVICLAAGTWVLARLRPTLLVVAFISGVIFASIVDPRYLFWPKGMLSLVPVLVTLSLAGFISLWTIADRSPADATRPGSRGTLSRFVRPGLIALLVIPWVVGVRVHDGSTRWGPGFELRPYDDDSPLGRTIGLTLGAGTAAPTSEGPRPIFGFGWVLLGGEWRDFLRERQGERVQAVETAVRDQLPLLANVGTDGRMLATILQLGFRTEDGLWARKVGLVGFRRTFFDAQNRRLELVYAPAFRSAEQLKALALAGGHTHYILFSSSSTVQEVHHAAPNALLKLNGRAAVLEIEKWPDAARQVTAKLAIEERP